MSVTSSFFLVLVLLYTGPGSGFLLTPGSHPPSSSRCRMRRGASEPRAGGESGPRVPVQVPAREEEEEERLPPATPPPPPPPRRSISPYEGESDFDRELRIFGISRRQLFLNTALAGLLAVGANFLGVTSGLLGLVPPQVVGDLDVVYPVKGFKKYRDEDDGYSFLYPQGWVADQALALAESNDRVNRLLGDGGKQDLRVVGSRSGFRPDAAFGPPGQGDVMVENVSVVKTRMSPGFAIKKDLGPPEKVGQFVLSTSIAPPGSGKNATLLSASLENREGGEVYSFEFTVKRPTIGLDLHSLAVVAIRPAENVFFTQLVVTQDPTWAQEADMLRKVARSFHLTR